jgi:DNA-directed RNA polymerase specialized sigma24 family protein
MTTDILDLRQEILGLEPSLLSYAGRLARDDNEARELVEFTMRTALESGAPPSGAGATRIWLYGLMRSAFHSVARRQTTARERGAPNRQWRADRAEAFTLDAKKGPT